MVALSSEFSVMLNPLYGYEAVQDQMKTAFVKSKPPVLLLQDFFVVRSYSSLAKTLEQCKEHRISEPDRMSFGSLELPQSLRALFVSPAFLDFVRAASGIKVKDVRLGALRFGHRDFTLMHDDAPAHGRCMFVYMIAPNSWESTRGGSLVFSYGDERDPLIFEPRANSFILLKTEKGMRDFIKYINHTAGKEQVTYLFGEFLIR